VGKPANTGQAGAIHRVVFFAGTPAPTEDRARLKTCIGPLPYSPFGFFFQAHTWSQVVLLP